MPGDGERGMLLFGSQPSGSLHRRPTPPPAAFLLATLLLLVSCRLANGTPDDADDYYDSYKEEADSAEVAVVPSHREARQETNAYYDFIVTEYSYKIWVAFMIYTMISVFYSCLVAAYFAETNTLAPTQAFDYDYVVKRSAYGEEASVLDAPPRLSGQVVGRGGVLRAISSSPPPPSAGEGNWAKGGVKRAKNNTKGHSWKHPISSADPT